VIGRKNAPTLMSVRSEASSSQRLLVFRIGRVVGYASSASILLRNWRIGRAAQVGAATKGNAAMSAEKLPARKAIYLGWKTHGKLVAQLALLFGAYQVTLWEVLCARQYIGYVSSLKDVQTRMSVLAFFGAYLLENVWIVIFGVGFALVIIWEFVRLTHRIVGPIKGLERMLYSMAEGKYAAEVKFRKGDLVEGLEKALNAYLSSPHVAAFRAGRASAEHEKLADSSAPTTIAKAPAMPFDEQQLAALIHDIQEANRPAGVHSN
jgi:hypothetical protein